MRATVTGGGGFLGQAICRQLVQAGAQVRSFSRSRYAELDQLGVTQLAGDLRDLQAVRSACREAEVVFHSAARAGIWGEWAEYRAINVVGTQNVLAACQEGGVGRLIYTSSPSVTFAGRDQCGVDESHPYPRRWGCNYARSKALAEQAVLGANRSDGLLTCALRPHLIWGPGDPHLVPRLIDRARRGRLRQIGSGANRIAMTYVDNAAAAHLQAAEALRKGSPVAGSAYFISQPEPVSCWEWINQILSLVNLPPVRRSVPYRVAWLGGGLCEAIWWMTGQKTDPPMTRFLASQLAQSHYFDLTRAYRDFDYRPPVETQQGMRRLANWLQSR
jgi:nucleoside-diphosphate-sugar epimerase